MSTFDVCPSRRTILASSAALAAPFAYGNFGPPAQAASAMLGAWQPKHRRVKLGAFELTTISDSEVFIDGPFPLIGKNASEDEVRKLMRENLLPEQKYQPGF